jgi:enhancing lycopene biosynthesis protein 2
VAAEQVASKTVVKVVVTGMGWLDAAEVHHSVSVVVPLAKPVFDR